MKLLEQIRLLGKENIARRYFVMNSIDGVFATFGIVIAMYLAGMENSRIVIFPCLGAAIALMVSGIWSAYVTEKAERGRELKKLERQMLRDLEDTRISRKLNRMVILTALVNGLSPLFASLILISPFILSALDVIHISLSYSLSLSLMLIILFLLGIFIGRVEQESLLKNGIKMLLAGVFIGIALFILDWLTRL